MKIDEIHKKYAATLKDRVVCYFIQDDKILLGLKKVRFGEGKITGIGGKAEEGESLEDALKRECREEVNLEPKLFRKVAILYYYFPEKPEWSQKVYAYICTDWNGTAKESEEMKPIWFEKKEIPLDKMWDDIKYWLPKVLNGDELECMFAFDLELKVADYKIVPKVISS